MLIFSNPGLLDPRLITTFGANLKPNSTNPIGHFGTGLKYAIAGILRGGGTITIYSGQHHYTFLTVNETIRGEQVPIVNIVESHSDPTTLPTKMPCGFTTTLGSHWEPWMIYRELWSNAKDEGGKVEEFVAWNKPDSSTHIVVEWPELSKAHSFANEFLLTDSVPTAIIPGMLEIHPGESSSVFFRGIKVASLSTPSIFTYNILSEQWLTEDRTLDLWQAKYAVTQALAKLTNQSLAEIILLAPKEKWENDFDFTYVDNLSPEMIAAVKLNQKNPTLNFSVKHYVRTHYLEDFLPTPIPQTSDQQVKLAEVSALLSHMIPDFQWTSFHLFSDTDGEDFYQNNHILFIQESKLTNPTLLPDLLNFWENFQPWKGPKLQHAFLAYVKAHHTSHKALLEWSDLNPQEWSFL